MRQTPTQPGGSKNIVLDTNILLHDPRCLMNFDEHGVWIPVVVLEELDRFKGEQTTRGANARRVHRDMDRMFPDPAAARDGYAKEQGGRVRILDMAKSPAGTRADDQILAEARALRDSGEPGVILVTKDLNLRIRARAAGIEAQNYRRDQARDEDATDPQTPCVTVDPRRLQAFASTGEVHVPSLRPVPEPGAYVLLAVSPGQTMPARHLGEGRFRRLRGPDQVNPRGARAIRPKNLEQRFLLDALYDEGVDIVTVYGTAGTGKTLLSVAAGLEMAMAGRFRRVLVSRSPVPAAEPLGFLPGSKDEKMAPWVQPAADAVEHIFAPERPPAVAGKARRRDGAAAADGPAPAGRRVSAFEALQASGLIEAESLEHIRGRSIPGAFMVIDEAQNLTPLQVKTIVTRVSEGTKIVLLGDTSQIDNPHLDALSNGLVHARNRLRGQGLAAHVNLVRGERSRLADLAARVL